jgi:NADH:ubiquinone oxidoreductase subunit 4 (subunit M)
MPLCLVVSVGAITSNVKTYAICFLMMESFLLLTFTSLDIICFYIFFEAVLIPMFILVSAYGSRERRVRAAYLLFMYTLIGSILMLFGILYIVYTVGSSDIVVLRNIVPFIFSESTQKLL